MVSRFGGIAALLLVLTACAPDAPLRIDTFQLGKALNPDGSVATHASSFKPEDTMYVSILTPDAGTGTIGVRWTFAGRVIDEPSKNVTYRGAAATEFHLVNSSGFPEGDYKVEVFLNGQPAGVREYRVVK